MLCCLLEMACSGVMLYFGLSTYVMSGTCSIVDSVVLIVAFGVVGWGCVRVMGWEKVNVVRKGYAVGVSSRILIVGCCCCCC